MKEAYLEVTFRRGRAIAAYLYLPRQPDEKIARSKRVEPGLVIDFNAEERPMGIEIIAPSQVSLADVNRALTESRTPPDDSGRSGPTRHAASLPRAQADRP